MAPSEHTPAENAKLETALAYARAGIPVFPCHSIQDRACTCPKGPSCGSPGKHPRTPNGLHDATTESAKIRKWWRQWPDANPAARLDTLVVVDVDEGARVRASGERVFNRGGETLAELEKTFGPLTRLVVTRSGSGGRHIWLRGRPGVRYPKSLGAGVDIKAGSGAYVVLHASSHISGGEYQFVKGDLRSLPFLLDLLPDAPAWISEMAGPVRRELTTQGDLSLIAHNRKRLYDFQELAAVTRAIRNDVRFDSRAEWIKVLAAIHFESDGSEEGLALAHEWSEGWEGGAYNVDETDAAWGSLRDDPGRRLTTGAYLMRLAREDGWLPKARTALNGANASLDPVERAVDRLNAIHAVIAHGGKTVILREQAAPTGGPGFALSRVADLHAWYENDLLQLGQPPKPVSVSKLWMRHERRRQYSGLVLDPSGKAAGAYNIWQGFGVAPDDSGFCDIFLDHLRDNVCSGDDEQFEYLLGYLAHLVQKPWEKPGVALALRGRKGTGKSLVSQTAGALLPRHTVKVSHARHLTGNFNAHLAPAILVRIEEAFWAGDKAGEAVLKDLITDHTFRMEMKGVDSIELASFHRLIFTSNSDWVVPASFDERRFAVFDVSDARAQDRGYFSRMVMQLNDGGYEKLLYLLLHHDLTGFDVGRPPSTTGLTAQKLASLTSIEGWWRDVLMIGALGKPCVAEFGSEGWPGPMKIWTEQLRASFEEWLGRRRHGGDPLSPDIFGLRLRRMCPHVEKKRRRVGRERGGGDDRATYYQLPSLEECRTAFEDWIGGSVHWDQ